MDQKFIINQIIIFTYYSRASIIRINLIEPCPDYQNVRIFEKNQKKGRLSSCQKENLLKPLVIHFSG